MCVMEGRGGKDPGHSELSQCHQCEPSCRPSIALLMYVYWHTCNLPSSITRIGGYSSCYLVRAYTGRVPAYTTHVGRVR